MNTNNKNIQIIEEIKCNCGDENFQHELLEKHLKRFKYKSVGQIYKILRDTELLNFSLSFSNRYRYDTESLNLDELNALELKNIMEGLLKFIGFNDMVKDYIIIVYKGKWKKLQSDGSFRYRISYDWEVLFDKPELSAEEIRLSLKNYFNYFFFLYRLPGLHSLIDINRYVRNNEELKQSLLEIRKELNEKLNGELENPFNKILGALEFNSYMEFFMNQIFGLFNNNPECRLESINYEELSKKAIEDYRQYTYGEAFQDVLCMPNNFHMVKNIKEGDDLKAEYMKNFSESEWYEFPESGMFWFPQGVFDEEFGMYGYGVYKDYIEDVKKEYGEV